MTAEDQDPFHEDGVLSQLATSTDRVLNELQAIRGMMVDRPRRAEVVKRRRGTAVLLGLLLLFSVQGSDLHTEWCGPGKRSEAVVQAFANHEIKTEADLNKVAKEATPDWWCGFTFPTHSHDHSNWPQPQHVAGMAFYCLLIVISFFWYWWPETWGHRPHRLRWYKRDRKMSA